MYRVLVDFFNKLRKKKIFLNGLDGYSITSSTIFNFLMKKKFLLEATTVIWELGSLFLIDFKLIETCPEE